MKTKKAGSILSKVIVIFFFSILIFSFVIWGIKDVITGSGQDIVAKIGNIEVSSKEVETRVLQELKQFHGIYGSDIPKEVLKLVFKKELENIVNENLLSLDANYSKLIISKEKIISEIRSFPIFQDEKGNFSEEIFKKSLEENNINLSELVSNIQKQMQREILINTFSKEISYPKNLSDLVYSFDKEVRYVNLLTIPISYVKADSILPPKEDELISFYEQNKNKFESDELRNIAYIEITKKDIFKNIKVLDSEILADYDNQKSKFKEEQSRNLRQIYFKTEDLANKAHQELKSGSDFFAVAKKYANQEKSETIYGDVTKSELMSQNLLTGEIIDGIFSIKANEFTKPLKSTLGWHIFSIADIKKTSLPSYKNSYNLIKNRLLAEKENAALSNLLTEIQNKLNEGVSLEKLSEYLKIEVQELKNINRYGKVVEQDNKQKLNFSEKFLQIAFTIDQDVQSDLFSTDNDSKFYVIKVKEISSPRIKALDEVRNLALELYNQEKMKEKLAEIANEIAMNLKSKTTTNLGITKQDTDKILSKYSLNFASSEKFTRADNAIGDTNKDLLDEIFKLEISEVSKPYAQENGTSIVIARLEKIISADNNEDAKKIMNEGLSTQIGGEILEQYMNNLRKKYKVKTNL